MKAYGRKESSIRVLKTHRYFRSFLLTAETTMINLIMNHRERGREKERKRKRKRRRNERDRKIEKV